MIAFATRRGRRTVRTTVAVGTVSLGLLALSGCQKPSPNAHFTLGSHTASKETAEGCHTHGGDPLGADRVRACLEGEDGVPVFTTHAGDTFRVGVDPEVAEDGWLLFYDGVLFDANPFSTTYQTFSVDELSRTARERNEEPGALPSPAELRLVVAQVNDDYDVEAIWSSASQEEFEERLFGSVEGVWNADLEPGD
jgi:hypothetical protein